MCYRDKGALPPVVIFSRGFESFDPDWDSPEAVYVNSFYFIVLYLSADLNVGILNAEGTTVAQEVEWFVR